MKIKYEKEVEDCSECDFFNINVGTEKSGAMCLDSIECNFKKHKFGTLTTKSSHWFDDPKDIKSFILKYPCQLRPCPIAINESLKKSLKDGENVLAQARFAILFQKLIDELNSIPQELRQAKAKQYLIDLGICDENGLKEMYRESK